MSAAITDVGSGVEIRGEQTTPQGFKRTEIGLIPADWGIKTLGELTTLLTNGFVGKATRHYTESVDGVLYIQGYNVLENGFNLHGVKHVTRCFHARHQKSCLRTGDLLTIQTGDIGVTAVVPIELAGSNCHALVISRFDNTVSEPRFYSQYFNSERGLNMFRAIETGSTMKHLNVGDMSQLPLPVPPVREQRAIAEVLSDADALIGALDKLISKKRAIKLATAHQLLTGTTRLPGFEKNWRPVTLGSFGKTYGGLTGKRKEDFGIGTARYIPFLNILNNVVLDVSNLEQVRVRESEGQNLARKGDLFFNGSSETPEEVGMCAVLLVDVENVYLNSFCFGFRLVDDAEESGLYLAYFFRSNEGRRLLFSEAQGATRYNLSKARLLKLEFEVPHLDEQEAIVLVLSDMDAEIAALERRRDKTKAIKQGMMQELLTGRNRLL